MSENKKKEEKQVNEEALKTIYKNAKTVLDIIKKHKAEEEEKGEDR